MIKNDSKPERERKALVVETLFFATPGAFFVLVALAYAFVTNAEPIGTMALAGLAFMFFFVTGYLWLTSRRVDFRASDDEEGEIHESAGEIGEFSPHSWWPFVAGVAATVVAAGFAVGWWMFGLGLVLGAMAVVGYAFENNRGVYAH
ncbi:cytochrome c oxidase subunit 4 [Flaviflexus salsibiostraticola]|uniref:Cytochrome c oxidase polypeptide 4 n=1 Tax=Flaviflexus salsibiostraticola TaxID=1282737 RepID=A0A3S8Z6E8_9ACTO|nr:cytochrome c oxidase subunit 4 [Flaviflexus salsibiostraticola]AZN29067.1 cytochrome c oxidase subunit 4 [Flaviflexus salsibiostraticola]